MKSALMQTMAVQNKNMTLQILRNLARAKCLFVPFSTDGDDNNKSGCNQFIHPTPTEGRESDIDYSSH